MEATAQLPMAMANLMLCCLLVVGPAVLPIGSTYPRPHSLTCIARIAVMMSRGAFALTLRLHVRGSGWVFLTRSLVGC